MKTNFLTIVAITIALAFAFSGCDKETSEFTEIEGNDSFDTASTLTIDNTYDAEINPAQDIDYFTISTTGTVSVTVAGETSLEVYVYIYDENKIEIYGGGTGLRGGSVTETIQDTEYDDKLYVKIESAYSDDTGSYTIKVE